MRFVAGATGVLILISAPVFGALIESLQIPSDGSTVYTSSVLQSGRLFDVVVSGLYRYDVGEPGEFADAQYREDDNNRYTIRFNSVEFDGVRLNANLFDLPNHTYTYYWTGDGSTLAFRIYDEPGGYGDNAGFLQADIHDNAVPEPSTLTLLISCAVAGLSIGVGCWRRRNRA
jgi:hypothetical protein